MMDEMYEIALPPGEQMTRGEFIRRGLRGARKILIGGGASIVVEEVARRLGWLDQLVTSPFTNFLFDKLASPEGSWLLEKLAFEANGQSLRVISSMPIPNNVRAEISQPNRNLMHMDKIIDDAISRYYQTTKLSPIYQPPSWYEGPEFYSGALAKVEPLKMIGGQDFFEYVARQMGEFNRNIGMPTEQRIVMGFLSRFNDLNRDNFDLPPLAGMQSRVAKALERTPEEIFPLDYNKLDREGITALVEDACYDQLNFFPDLEYLGRTASTLEDVYLVYLLLNKGRLLESLWDTAIYTKYITRHTHSRSDYIPDDLKRELGRIQPLKDNFNLSSELPVLIKYWKDYLRDIQKELEGGRLNIKYTELDPINRAGALYHAASDVAALTAFPAAITIAGIISVQKGNSAKDQGYGKFAADLYVCSRLSAVQEILNKYRS